MTTEVLRPDISADAAAGEAPINSLDDKINANLPMRKRKKADEDSPDATPDPYDDGAKRVKEEGDTGALQENSPDFEEVGDDLKPLKRAPMSKAREIRLEQNRKAARESRRRKKVMIEELQRSVIFFSRANGTLKQQNDDLSRVLLQAQAQISAIEAGKQHQQAQQNNNEQSQQALTSSQQNQVEAHHQSSGSQNQMAFHNLAQQVQAQAVATQAMYESQGYPSAAARVAAQTMNASGGGNQATSAAANAPAPSNMQSPQPAPAMQTGATMQAMANFQQAAAAAMQAAMGMAPVTGAPATTHQQAYDTLNAFAMQQAAAAAAGQAQFGFLPQMQQNLGAASFLGHPAMQFAGNPMAWQNAVANNQVAAPPVQQQPTDQRNS